MTTKESSPPLTTTSTTLSSKTPSVSNDNVATDRVSPAPLETTNGTYSSHRHPRDRRDNRSRSPSQRYSNHHDDRYERRDSHRMNRYAQQDRHYSTTHEHHHYPPRRDFRSEDRYSNNENNDRRSRYHRHHLPPQDRYESRYDHSRYDSRYRDDPYRSSYDSYSRPSYHYHRQSAHYYEDRRQYDSRSRPTRRVIDRGTEEERQNSSVLFVGNLPYAFREQDVARMFERYGKLAKITIPIDTLTTKNKGFAFVEFEERHEAQEALDNYQGFSVEGRRLKLDWDIGLDRKDTRRSTQQSSSSSLKEEGYRSAHHEAR
ncbi:uncharacterized protein BX664DRAFT_328365 [Halteromyces radiatus]|uniref:uncharacterized protein n=1 Tax=Halteromyces radiatus TaxID=101107 RepID=UPI002220CCF5|nr:uncharacterized protein BX664DRAFT_328365 [Halteromyces radiatus]KAI8092876.1 hypothetical protein BX664DRAFT_328365 [Halteromyces radiatus]